ncbi:MAG: hypothetical protein COA43_10635 [Robiginitomaculum sp.]|nr:MAG: hypothetical protein COA43_10635 [Robiginitomaculum sp.]
MKQPHSESKTEPKQYERPSQRMFRRSRAAESRRRLAARKEERFMRTIFGICGFALMLAMLFFFMFSNTVQAQEMDTQQGQSVENAPATEGLMAPVLGNFTGLDMIGFAFVAIAGFAVYRRFARKD